MFTRTGRYSVDFLHADNPTEWERHQLLNSDNFGDVEDFYFAAVGLVCENTLATILGIRLYDHRLNQPVIEWAKEVA